MVGNELFIRLIMAVILSGAIGLERQWRHRLAGIRTNVLVGLGSFLFVIVSVLIEDENSPTRLAAQVVSGIGFLGAGVILRDGYNVRGLNTAATLWCSAAIGTLTALGFLREAILGTIFILTANIFLRSFASKISINNQEIDKGNSYSLWAICDQREEHHLRSLLMQLLNNEKMMLENLESLNLDQKGQVKVKAAVQSLEANSTAVERIAKIISIESHINAVGWEMAKAR